MILDEKEGERFREIGPGLVERCRDMFGAQILCYVSGDIFCEEMEKLIRGCCVSARTTCSARTASSM